MLSRLLNTISNRLFILQISIGNNRWNFVIIGGVVVIAFVSGRQSVLDNNGIADLAWFSDFWQNFSTEMMGAVITFMLFEVVTNKRGEIADLIIQMRSKDNATALTASERIIARNWHRSGVLKGADLGRANLAGAEFREANLQGANLLRANLSNTKLKRTNLAKANFWGANLSDAELWGANLSGANLWEASLSGANLKDTKFDEKTVLPDSRWIDKDDDNNTLFDKYWTPNTDMRRYTHPKHPDFWQPNWVKCKEEQNKEAPVHTKVAWVPYQPLQKPITKR